MSTASRPSSVRPLLRVAALTAGSLLVGCGSATGGPGDPQPLPGNPKGSHFDDAATNAVIVSGTITLADGVEPTAAAVFVSVRAKDAPGPPLAAKKLPVGPFPMAFELTAADRPMATGPLPAAFAVKVTLDSDGDPMSRTPTDPTVTVDATNGQTGLAVAVGAPAPPPK